MNQTHRLQATIARLMALLRKEYLQFFRDRSLIYIVLYVFTLEIYLAGTGFNIEVRNYPTAIFDRDRTQWSLQLAEKFRMPHFRVDYLLHSEAEMVDLLNRGAVSLVVVIPHGFAQALLEKNRASVQAITDGTLSNTSLLALGYADQMAHIFALELGQRLGKINPQEEHLQPQVTMKPQVLYNPNQKGEWFASLIELFSVITLVSILLPAAAMVREKEYGTIEQLLVTPINPVEIMSAKIISMSSIILTASLASLFLIIFPVFNLPWRGSLLLFLGATNLYVFCATGFGMFIATICRNLPQTILLVIMIIAPILFLSGSWTPLEAMPPVLGFITYLSPLKHYLNIAYNILLKGAGLANLWQDFLNLNILGFGLFAICAFQFRRHFG
ncbi:ABC transporter permease [Desulfobacca acetoxidans]|uniref:ABC-2 type transporter n=1 Tax=Desulfobacca acetoxidans (strain ATCC 700848 / DSM 11109 / ASRB2) TaxID=880072 RepID=F2NER0_DESAR|nr:ABC transporter permease [Desulfobacca acetoxidans]AEB08250.1 ABC-2 type transporter [Desulfobacca acetoxidans DSM 11109]HAY23387.1 ABC transporter permease [Desulfobacterales bacterium]